MRNLLSRPQTIFPQNQGQELMFQIASAITIMSSRIDENESASQECHSSGGLANVFVKYLTWVRYLPGIQGFA
jgi:hypothetical protein